LIPSFCQFLMTLLAINKARFLKTEVSKHSHRFLLRIQILKTRGKKKLVYKNLKLIQRYRLKCAATEIQWHYTHPIVGLNSQSLAAKGATRHANPGLTSPPYQKKVFTPDPWEDALWVALHQSASVLVRHTSFAPLLLWLPRLAFYSYQATCSAEHCGDHYSHQEGRRFISG
jgi:hypothetical protein